MRTIIQKFVLTFMLCTLVPSPSYAFNWPSPRAFISAVGNIASRFIQPMQSIKSKVSSLMTSSKEKFGFAYVAFISSAYHYLTTKKVSLTIPDIEQQGPLFEVLQPCAIPAPTHSSIITSPAPAALPTPAAEPSISCQNCDQDLVKPTIASSFISDSDKELLSNSMNKTAEETKITDNQLNLRASTSPINSSSLPDQNSNLGLLAARIVFTTIATRPSNIEELRTSTIDKSTEENLLTILPPFLKRSRSKSDSSAVTKPVYPIVPPIILEAEALQRSKTAPCHLHDLDFNLGGGMKSDRDKATEAALKAADDTDALLAELLNS